MQLIVYNKAVSRCISRIVRLCRFTLVYPAIFSCSSFEKFADLESYSLFKLITVELRIFFRVVLRF